MSTLHPKTVTVPISRRLQKSAPEITILTIPNDQVKVLQSNCGGRLVDMFSPTGRRNNSSSYITLMGSRVTHLSVKGAAKFGSKEAKAVRMNPSSSVVIVVLLVNGDKRREVLVLGIEILWWVRQC